MDIVDDMPVHGACLGMGLLLIRVRGGACAAGRSFVVSAAAPPFGNPLEREALLGELANFEQLAQVLPGVHRRTGLADRPVTRYDLALPGWEWRPSPKERAALGA